MNRPDLAAPAGDRLSHLGLLAVLAVTAAAYAPSLGGEFVFDDHRFVVENRAIGELGDWPRFFTDASTMTATYGVSGWRDIYRPLRTLSFAVDRALFGLEPLGYRLENLALHLLAVALAYRLLRRLLRSPGAALLGAAVFALHPAQTQSVAWIASRGDLLAAVFLLGSSLLLLRRETTSWATAAGLLLYALALLSKESAVALLVLVPVLDRLLVRVGERPRWRLHAALAGITVLFVVVRFSQTEAQAAFSIQGLLASGSSLVILTGKLLVPVGLLPYTGDILTTERLGTVAGGVALAFATVLVIALLVRGYRAPRVAAGLLWMAICVAPVSGLVPLKSLAESRFLHLPLLGFGMIVGLVAARAGRRGLILGAVVAGLLGSLTARESRVWTGDRPLWEAAVARESRLFGEGGYFVLDNLGRARTAEGDPGGAVEALRRSLAVRERAATWGDLALAEHAAGDPKRALESARRGVALDPACVPARHDLGRLLLLMGRPGEAAAELAEAERLAPELGYVKLILGWALLESGRAGEAVGPLRATVEMDSGGVRGWVLLGKALHASGNPAGAQAAFGEARRLDAGSPVPLLGLARLLLDRERPTEAIPLLERALSMDAGNPAVRAEHAAALGALPGASRSTLATDMQRATEELARGGDLHSVISALGRPAVRRLEDADLENRLVQALLGVGERERARAELRALLPRRAQDPFVRGNLGILALESGRAREAIPHVEAAVTGDPGSFVLRLVLARAYRAAGREEDARRAAKEAERRAAGDAEREAVRRFLAGE